MAPMWMVARGEARPLAAGHVRIKTSNTQTTSRTAATTRYRSLGWGFWLGSVILLISVPRCTAPDYRAAMTATTNIMPKITFQKMPASAGHRRPHQGHLHADVETSCPQSSHFANAMRTLWHEASGIVDLLRSPRRWPMTIEQRVAKLERQNRERADSPRGRRASLLRKHDYA